MKDNSSAPPTDDQIDELILKFSRSGRVSPNSLDMLAAYIRAVRHRGSGYKQYINQK